MPRSNLEQQRLLEIVFDHPLSDIDRNSAVQRIAPMTLARLCSQVYGC